MIDIVLCTRCSKCTKNAATTQTTPAEWLGCNMPSLEGVGHQRRLVEFVANGPPSPLPSLVALPRIQLLITAKRRRTLPSKYNRGGWHRHSWIVGLEINARRSLISFFWCYTQPACTQVRVGVGPSKLREIKIRTSLGRVRTGDRVKI